MIGPLRGPVLIRPFPTPHEASGLCAVGLPQFKASGLAEVFDLIAWTSSASHRGLIAWASAPHSATSSPGPAAPHIATSSTANRAKSPALTTCCTIANIPPGLFWTILDYSGLLWTCWTALDCLDVLDCSGRAGLPGRPGLFGRSGRAGLQQLRAGSS